MTRSEPVTVTEDLRIEVKQPERALTPDQALDFAQQLVLRAMMRKAAIMPHRRTRELRARRVGMH